MSLPFVKFPASVHNCLRNVLALAAILVTWAGISAKAQTSTSYSVPADRCINWGAMPVGFPGGIPIRTVIYKDVVKDGGADNTGVKDCTAIVQQIINACPYGQVVYFPAGSYRISSVISMQTASGVTIRGAGMGKTTFVIYTGSCNGAFDVGASEWPKPVASLPILSGATKGSTKVYVKDTSGIKVSRMLRIEQQDLPWVHELNGQTNTMSCIVMPTAKDATSVTFTPPLPYTLTNFPAMASYSTFLVYNTGFEDLSFELANSQAGSAIFIEQAYGCWIKNVEVVHCFSRQFILDVTMNCEIRECYLHDTQGGGANHEGIDLYESACWTLIENNMCVRGGYPMIILGDARGGCVGNVVAYNYLENVFTGNDVAGYAMCDNHGPHNMMNLFEGNVAQNFSSDGYFGGSSHGTLFRNYFSGVFDKTNLWPIAIMLDHWADYYNLVGNVLGSNGFSAILTTTNGSYAGEIGVIYRFGYPNCGNSYYYNVSPPATNANAYDTSVTNTILLHGNFDYASGKTAWDANSPNHTLPASLYLTNRPAWWTSTVPWPPIGSDLNPMVVPIPAQRRYLTLLGSIPPTPTGFRRLN